MSTPAPQSKELKKERFNELESLRGSSIWVLRDGFGVMSGERDRKIVERNLLKTIHIEREKDFETPRGQTLHVGVSLCLSIKVKYIVFF